MGDPLSPEAKPGGLLPVARERFRAALAAAGFTLFGREANGTERWDGTAIAQWRDPESGEEREATHKIRIALWSGFPFQAPSAFAMDPREAMPNSRHAQPLPNGSLCLYAASYRPDTQRGWAPWRTGEEYLARLRELLSRMHSGEWDEHDRPPDLHTAFPQAKGDPAMTLVGEGWLPPSGSRFGRFGIWRRSASIVLADGPVADVGVVPAKPADERVNIVLGLYDQAREAVGVWFRLDREPGPRGSLGAVLAEIDRASGQDAGWALGECRRMIGADAGGKRPVFLALGYPDPMLGAREGWLFLEARPAGPGTPIRWREAKTLAQAGVSASETVPINRAALMRRTGPIAAAVEGKTVLVFGVGALGGTMALLLARSGIERLILVDGDRIRPGNAVRHVGDISHTGRLKTSVLFMDIIYHVPNVYVEEHVATWDPERLRAYVARADVVVDATAEQPFSLLLNAVCVAAGRPLVQVETTRRAAFGRVRVIRPGRDACLLCYEAHAQSTRYPIVPAGDEGEFFDEGCGVPTVEAPALDVEATANWAARAVLWLLQDRLGPRNHLLVVNEELADVSGDLAVVGVHWDVFARVMGCECCDDAHGSARPVTA
ncbi:ThiF family adenylyltransferase [Gemmatimonas sp.]|uniref:HesA/MoeB/ThiF family protein n=1 Tax=Gemmatimonas sp. TaxID=1962908 RepID=UPI00286D7FF6|nr:ThiF family adenylyltransferase [Gemmatimonas sp.]